MRGVNRLVQIRVWSSWSPQGNSGYGHPALSEVDAPQQVSLADVTINDPGNAERAITVGSTHRDAPHTYGVSLLLLERTDRGRALKARPGCARRAITSCAAGDAAS